MYGSFGTYALGLVALAVVAVAVLALAANTAKRPADTASRQPALADK